MSVPEVVPILHEPGYRTDTIGRCGGGQFFASVCYASPEGPSGPDGGAWYAVLHRFDESGRHLGSRIETVPEESGSAAPKAVEDLLREWLDALPEREFADIAVAPFTVLVDGCRFGLVVERHHEDATEDDWAEFYPDRLGFHAPWDGEYDT